MEMKKCPATLIGIRHGSVPNESHLVRRALKQFTRIAKNCPKGATFYIEAPAKAVEEHLGIRRMLIYGYELLIDIARAQGLRIVGLDGPKIWQVTGVTPLEAVAYWKKLKSVIKTEITPQEAASTIRYYLHWKLRERKWINILRNAREGDLIVMHPNHATAIASGLSLRQKDIVFIHPPMRNYIKWRKAALKAATVSEIRKLVRKFKNQGGRPKKKQPT